MEIFMISWTLITDKKPPNNTWVLASYYMKDRNIWRTRIYEWKDDRDNRKITHWSFINAPN